VLIFCVKMKVGGLANLSLDRPIPKVPSCEKECGTAYIVQTTRPYRSLCHIVKVRHRFYEPHHFDTKATPVHIDCQNLALAFNKKGAEPIAVDTSFHDGRKCFWINDNLRCPIVAFSVDARHTAIGKLGELPWIVSRNELEPCLTCMLFMNQCPRRRKHGTLVSCCTYTPG